MPCFVIRSNILIPMETIIIGTIALLLIGYLVVAMIHPEKF